MAEVFGIFVGAVNIATTFSAVIEVFDYVQLGRRFGRDYQTSQLKLTLLRLRLSRWGEAVDVYNDPQLGDPSATPAKIKAAKNTLAYPHAVRGQLQDIEKVWRQGRRGLAAAGLCSLWRIR